MTDSPTGNNGKVLVSGSAGFIGGYVVEELLDRGYSVVGIDNYSKYGPVEKSYDNHPDYYFVEDDVRNVDVMKKLLSDCDHLVAGAALIGGISYFHAYAYDLLATNERIMASQCDAAIEAHQHGKLKKVTYLSSSMVFESTEHWPSKEGDERKIPPPLSSYGFQKLALEYFAKAAWEQYQLPYTIVRPFNCVGIGEGRALGDVEIDSGNVKLAMSHVVPDLVQKIVKGQDPLHILGEGNQIRHYTYGGDLARGIVECMEQDAAFNDDFNISTRESTSVRELAEVIWRKIKGPDVPLRIVSDPAYEYDVQKRVPDVTKATEVLGVECTTTLDDMLDEVIPWVTQAVADGKLDPSMTKSPEAAAARESYLLGLGVSVFLVGAPATVMSYGSLDDSWRLGLNIGHADGFEFGRDMVFTYGPWGYFDHPAPFGGLHYLLALTYAVLVAAVLYAAVHVALRRWELSPVPAAVGAAAVTGVLGTLTEHSALAAAAAGLLALLHATDETSRTLGLRWCGVTLLPVALALAAGLLLQIKLSVGVTVAVVALLTALAGLSVRSVLVDGVATVVALVGGFLLFWTLAGQDPRWLPEWFRGSASLVRGYADAMSTPGVDRLFDYVVTAALAVFVVALLVRLGRRAGFRRTIVPALLAAVLAEFAFKATFIRYDDKHELFFTIATVVLLGFAPLAHRRLWAVVAVVGALVMMAPGTSWLDFSQPRAAWRVALPVAVKQSAADYYNQQAQGLGQATYGLPAEFVTAIGDRPVAVDPYESAVAIDYGMTWHPWPVMQAYSAYTPYLDRLNARAARSASADQVVLRYPTAAIEGRNPHWETPEYLLTLACQYTQEMTNGSWNLLSHDQPRCGQRREVSSADVDADEAVAVPEGGPGEVVLASFVPDGDSLLDKLETTFLRDPHRLSVSADGQTFQVPVALASGPLLVGYPDRGEQGIFPAFHYGQLSFTEPGTVTFSTMAMSS